MHEARAWGLTAPIPTVPQLWDGHFPSPWLSARARPFGPGVFPKPSVAVATADLGPAI